MQHWYACQAEVATREAPMTDHIVLSILIGAMYLHILQLPHIHPSYDIFLWLQVQLLHLYAGTVCYLEPLKLIYAIKVNSRE